MRTSLPLIEWFARFVVCESTDTVAAVAARISAERAAVVLIRRTFGTETRYYIVRASDFTRTPRRGNASLMEAFRLQRKAPAVVVASQDLARDQLLGGPNGGAVILDGGGSPREVGLLKAGVAPGFSPTPSEEFAPPAPNEETIFTSGDAFAAEREITRDEAPATGGRETLRESISYVTEPPGLGGGTAASASRATARARPPLDTAPAGVARTPLRGSLRKKAKAPRRGPTKNGGPTRARGARAAVLRRPKLRARGPEPRPVTADTGAVANGGSRRASEDRRDPPRTAFSRISGPDRVVVGDEFAVSIGLAAEPQSGVEGGIVRSSSIPPGPYRLDIQVSADGFSKRRGEYWRHPLRVTYDKPNPSFDLHLTARPQKRALVHRQIRVKYAIAGQVVGFGLRTIAVGTTSKDLPQKMPRQRSTASLSAPAGVPVVDLTATIRLDESEPGRLEWTFDIAQGLLASLPDAALYKNIGRAPRDFASRLAAIMTAREGQAGVAKFLLGSGKNIAKHIPHEFWNVLRALAPQVAPRLPTVQILTEEPYVPWELAEFPKPLLSPTAPPFLAAQSTVARWVPGIGADPKPAAVPPDQAPAKTMAVIRGQYPDGGKYGPLHQSAEEARELIANYAATPIEAGNLADVLAQLGQPIGEILHFACHGSFEPKGTTDGLIMVDGSSLAPEQISTLNLERRPFVFLNACQVGRSQELLGDYSGMAEAFLVAGASGVIAPLWAIKDSVAREIAEKFYRRVFDDRAAPGDVLREERCRFAMTDAAESATWMAYIFFGHPALKLAR